MPTYQYRCEHCGQLCEFFQSINDSPKKICPACRRAALKKLIGPGAGVIFKGPGFYATDYRSKEYKEKAKKEK